MKAQPTHATSLSTRARVNTVYPPNKRAAVASYSQNHLSVQRNSSYGALSPRSAAVAAVNKRRSGASSPRHSAPYPQRAASSSSARRTPPPPSHSHGQPSQLAQLAHRRALVAQRQALYARRAEYRWAHVSTLDRGIRLLLEEEYREEVKAWMLEKEKTTVASATAMDQQPELQWHMRSHLLDFLLEIHLHFRLRPETLYLTMSILDRYVSRRVVYKKHYQLVGCVALWLAAKFEDAKERVPTVKDLKKLCGNQYDEGSFAQMEGHVLSTIDWDLGHPTAESWLRVLCTETPGGGVMTGLGMFGGHGSLAATAFENPLLFQQQQPFEDMRTQHVARFLMELTLYARDFVQFPPSIVALGALCLAREICGKPRRFADESPECLRLIALLDQTLSQALDSVSQTLVKKYSYAYYSKASSVVVTFYLRGNRYPFHTHQTAGIDTPEALVTYEVSIDTLLAARQQQRQVPATPVRERAEVRWGSGRTDVEETPRLVRSDSSSSVMDVDPATQPPTSGDVVDEDVDDEDTRSVRSFSQPREFEDPMDDDDEDEVDQGEVEDEPGSDLGLVRLDEDEDEDEGLFEMEPATTDATVAGGAGFRHHRSSSGSMMSDSQSSQLTVPSSDDNGPITPVTPMFQLDPFGTAQQHQHQYQQQHQQQPPPAQVQVPIPVVSSKDKENVVPGGAPAHHHHGHHHSHSHSHHLNVHAHPCLPSTHPLGGVVGDGADAHVRVETETEGGTAGEYRHALVAIVP